MANLVSNRLVITDGNADTLANTMLRDLENYGMEFFKPMPKYLLTDQYEKGEPSNPGWMQWAYANWGTKWDIYEDDRRLVDHDTLLFTTANDTIEPFVDWLQLEYPEVSITLFSQEEFEETESMYVPEGGMPC